MYKVYLRSKQGQVKKGQILNVTKNNKKVSIRCSLSSDIQWYHLFSCATFRTSQNMHLSFCSIMQLIYLLKNEKEDNSAIFWDIKLKFATGAHLENVLDKFLRFLKNSKFLEIFFKTFFRQNFCSIFTFLIILKIPDSSLVAPSSLLHSKPNKWS